MALDKFSTKNKKMIIKGAGKFMARIPGCSEIITLGHMTNMRLDIQLDIVDIEGGDTTAPIDTLLRKKTIDITAEDAKFDLNLVRLVLGSKLREGVSGLPYEMVNETTNVGADGQTITITQTVFTGADAPDIQVYNTGTGQFVPTTAITGAGTSVIATTGVSAADQVIVYYPISSSQIDPDGYIWELEEKHDVASGAIQLNYPLFGGTLGTSTSKREHISVRVVTENKLLTQTTSTSPAEDEFYVDVNTGEITFSSYLEDVQVYVNYKRPEVVDLLDIGSKDFPLTVSVVHDGKFEQKDGSIQGYQTELFSCRVKSNFTIDAARQTAATHSVTLTVIDPERSDGRLGSIKRYQILQDKDDC